MEKYSVLMSVYYKEKPEWLKISIDSMLAQTVKPDEFVIVKDGKLPGELDRIVTNYVEKYPNLFKIIELKENMGLGPALACGVNKCNNEIIIRMDSDDYSIPERCEMLLKKHDENPECDVIGSYEAEFEDSVENIVAIHKVPESVHDVSNFMRKRCALLHPTVLYKKSSVIKCGNYRSIKLYEDYDLFMRMILENKMKGCNIPKSLYYIRINDDFFKRRGGWSYMKTAVKFKYKQYENKNISLFDFIISAGGQALVCLMPNSARKKFYLKVLRR